MSHAREILARAFDIPCADVPQEASIENLAAWDSLGHLRVIAAIEEELGRHLDTDEVLTVIDLASIEQLLNGSRAA